MTLTDSLENSFGAASKTDAAAANKIAAKTIVYKAVEEHLCCDLNGEAVVLSLANGKYYGLNEVGSRIWELLQQAVSPDEIEAQILREYDVDAATCRQEVNDFLRRMLAEKLILPIERGV